MLEPNFAEKRVPGIKEDVANTSKPASTALDNSTDDGKIPHASEI